MTSRATPIFIVFLALSLAALPRPEPPLGRPERRPVGAEAGTTWIVKFVEDKGLRLTEDGRLLAPDGVPCPGWDDLTFRIPGAERTRLFARPPADLERDRRRGEERVGRPLRDLGLYARIRVPFGWEGDVPSLVHGAVPDARWIESIYPEAQAEPASLGEGTSVASGGPAKRRGVTGRPAPERDGRRPDHPGLRPRPGVSRSGSGRDRRPLPPRLPGRARGRSPHHRHRGRLELRPRGPTLPGSRRGPGTPRLEEPRHGGRGTTRGTRRRPRDRRHRPGRGVRRSELRGAGGGRGD